MIKSETDYIVEIANEEDEQKRRDLAVELSKIMNDKVCVKCRHHMHHMCMELNVDLHQDLDVNTHDFGCNKFEK